MEKIKLHWATKEHNIPGNALGYNQHNSAMRKFSEPYFDFDENAEIALTICPADFFVPIPGKTNILFCLAPETKIATADLQWVPVKDLKMGDEVIGFDEDLTLGHKNCYRKSTILGTSRFVGRAFKVKTSSSEVIASGNHLWVTRTPKKGRKWTRTDQLKPGDTILGWRETWVSSKDYDSGWMSGFLDGEGYVSNTGNGNTVGFAQNEGIALNRACELLTKFGFTYHKTKAKNSAYPKNTCWGVQIHNGIKALGVFRPERLIKKSALMWENHRSWSHKYNPTFEVVSVEEIGECELIGTMTSTGTIIAEGMLSHNTMWESLDLPNNYLQRIMRADALIVPCTFCRDLFRPHFEGPIYVCREGIDPGKFQYHERHFPRPGEKFRFLWLGASNPRKGYPIIMEIADKIIQRYQNIEVYLKTTTQKMDRKTYVTKLWKQRNALRAENPATFKEMLVRAKNPDVSDKVLRIGANNNVIWDSRILPFNDLVELYNSAHCFLFPTFGEGWGLTLCEAMATGLPVIATPVTGCADYFDDEVGFTIKHDIRYSEFTNYNIISRVFCPDTNHVVKRMFEIMQNYPEALRRARRGSDRIRNKFTWEHSAQRLRDIIQEISETRVIRRVVFAPGSAKRETGS